MKGVHEGMKGKGMMGINDIPARTREIWVTGDGDKVAVKDMTDSHLANTINLIHRKAEVVRGAFRYFSSVSGGDEARDLFLKGIVTYPALVREAERRKLRKEYRADSGQFIERARTVRLQDTFDWGDEGLFLPGGMDWEKQGRCV